MTQPSLQEDERLSLEDLRSMWRILSVDERVEAVGLLARPEAEELFLSLSAADLAGLVLGLPRDQRRSWMRLLAPDDAADVVQQAPPDQREALLALLDDPTRSQVSALLAYAEDAAGGLMNPRYGRLRPEMTIDEAISYLRRQASTNIDSLTYLYVLEEEQRLLGVVSFRELFAAKPEQRVRDVMRKKLVTVREHEDQEVVSRLLAEHGFFAIPVVDDQGRLKGIITLDDIVDVVQEEATEDIQKFGGMNALGAPYLEVAFGRMFRSRAGWLTALFLGETLTASAMALFEQDIARMVVLALFVPLIISSGGNSGSQASTLVVRAMALGEVRPRDWWRVMRRELASGLALGGLLGGIGFARIVLWQAVSPIYGEHYMGIALSVSASLLGVVMLGTLAGSLLPFVFQRLGFDPASASAPFVATLVDVTGLLIYFSMASLILSDAF